MKKNFMTRALSVVLSAAMALSLSVVANVASADAAAAKPAFKKATKTIAAAKKQVKFYTTAKTKKNFTLTKVKNTSTDVKVSVNKAKQVITVKRAAAELAADTSATIKVTFKNKKTTKKVTKNVKVNVKANKAEEVKVEELKITELTAPSSTELVAKLSIAVPVSGTAVTVSKDGAAVDGTGKISENGLEATFTAKADFTKGTYTMTVKDGEKEAKADIALDDKAATQITITDVALTNANPEATSGGAVAGALAYIYYDVKDQYGKSVRTTVNLTWTTSAGKPVNNFVDAAKGKFTVKNGDGKTPFMYGSDIYVVAVDTKTGLNYSTSVKVGMAQKLDAVKMEGFIDTKNPTKIDKTLPANFAKNRYVLAYQALDQNGNVMDSGDGVDAAKDVTFFTDAVTVVDSTKLQTAGKTYTIGDVEYFTRTVEPAMYYDKGGDVTFTAISNGTGKKTDATFTIGAGARLQSLELSYSKMVTDGETITLDYVAKDTNGNTTKDYESIVRSTNALNLNATSGILKVEETNDGEAKITWQDTEGAVNFNKNQGINEMDGQDRIVSLSTVVVGGESNMLQLSIKDAKRPVAIKEITAVDGLVEKSATKYILDRSNTKKSTIYFKDQYGNDCSEDRAYDFFFAGETDNAEKYFVNIDVDNANTKLRYNNAASDAAIGEAVMSVEYKLIDDISVATATDTVKLSIVKMDMKDAIPQPNTASPVVSHVISEYAFKTVMDAVEMKSIGLQRIDTDKSGAANGAEAGLSGSDFASLAELSSSSASLTVDKGATVGYEAKYDGKTLAIDNSYYNVVEDTVTMTGSAIYAVTSAAGIKWGSLYDSSAAGNPRKNASVQIKAQLADPMKYTNTGAAVYLAAKTFEVSDAARKATTITFNNAKDGKLTITPSNMAKAFSAADVTVKDQYGVDFAKTGLVFELTAPKESDVALTHVSNSLKFENNGTDKAGVKGAEIKDTFMAKATVGGATVTVEVTVGADAQANITDKANADKTWRIKTPEDGGLNYVQ